MGRPPTHRPPHRPPAPRPQTPRRLDRDGRESQNPSRRRTRPQGFLIPPNVASALNLYQLDSFWIVRGEPLVRAEDPSRTRILGNLRFSYRGKRIPLGAEPWIRRAFLRGHLMLEYDAEVWSLVESRLLEAIP